MNEKKLDIQINLKPTDVEEIITDWVRSVYPEMNVEKVIFSLAEAGDQRDTYKVFGGSTVRLSIKKRQRPQL